MSFDTHFDGSIPPVLVDATGFENALLNLYLRKQLA